MFSSESSDQDMIAGIIDVVIPMRNGAATIARALASVFAQTLGPRRIIVVDDGSTDGGGNLIRGLPLVDVIVTPPKGVSHARNVGIKAARAEYIAFLDCDDLWLPGKLQRQMEIFKRCPEVSVVNTGFIHADANGKAMRGTHYRPKLRGYVFTKMLRLGFSGGGWCSSIAARRGALLQSGGFDEQLSYGEDLDMWLRLAHDYAFDYCPDVHAYVVENPISTARSAMNPHRFGEVLIQNLSIMEKWIGVGGVPANIVSTCSREILIRAVRYRMGCHGLSDFRVQLERRVPKLTARIGRNDLVFFLNLLLGGVFGAFPIFMRLMRFLKRRKNQRDGTKPSVKFGVISSQDSWGRMFR